MKPFLVFHVCRKMVSKSHQWWSQPQHSWGKPPYPPPQRWLRPLSRTKARLAAEKTRAKQIQAEANLLPTPLARLLLPTRSAARSPVIYHSLADLLSGVRKPFSRTNLHFSLDFDCEFTSYHIGSVQNRDGGSTNLRSRLI